MIHNLEQRNIHLFLEEYKIKTEKGTELDFYNHPYLWDIYQDLSPKQVCLKAAQIGFTTMAIIKSAWLCRYRGMDGIYCVDDKTEILTETGFKFHTDLKCNDKILTLGLNGISQWTKVEEVFRKKVDMDLISFEGRNFSALTTDNHRWIVKDKKDIYKFIQTKDLNKHDFYIPKTAKIKRNSEPLDDDYIKLLSWIFSEGYYGKQKNKNDWSIIITQSKKVNNEKCEEIRNILKRLKVVFTENNIKNGEIINFRFAHSFGMHIKKEFPEKIPTYEFAKKLSPRQARRYLETFVKADGWIDGSGTSAITQKSKKGTDLLCFIAVIAGYSPSVVKPSVNGCHTIRMTQAKKAYTLELKPKSVRYNGIIWCPRTKFGTFYARRNGRCYWTGNTLPTAGDINEFSSGKVNRIIANNPILQQWTKDKDSVEQKRWGNNVIYYRGTWTDKTALMVSSDLNIHDEEDRSKLQVISQYASRLQHSKFKWEWHFSNPSVQGHGVSRYWKDSTQNHWFVKCSHCNQRQYISYPDSFDEVKEVYICKHCLKEITQEDIRKGEWVYKYKNKEFSGYWISLMTNPTYSAKDILKYKKSKPLDYFYNFVLGLPAISDTLSKVTPDIIFRNLIDEINDQENVVIGCDSGLQKHFVVGNDKGIFYYGKTDTWEDIEGLLKRFKRSVCVIDALPDLTEPRKLREKYKGRIFLCHYARDRKTMQLIRWGKDSEYGNVIVDRNRMIQVLIDEFADGRIPLQGSQEDWMDYYKHWDDIYRITENDALGVPVSRWETTTGEDHYCHATCYWRVAMDRFGHGKGDIIGDNDIIKAERGVELAPDGTHKLILPDKNDDWR